MFILNPSGSYVQVQYGSSNKIESDGFESTLEGKKKKEKKKLFLIKFPFKKYIYTIVFYIN